MDPAEITAVVEDFFQNEAGVDDPSLLRNGTDLIEAGVLDSMLMVMLIGHCEERFDLELDPEDLTEENFRSLDAIVTYIAAKL